MENDLLTIRQMTDKYDVTARTLRFYEYKELLSPVREGQKRLYTKADQARLKLILRAKLFGFSLDEIYQMLILSMDAKSNKDAQLQIIQMAERQLNELRVQQKQIEESILGLEQEIAVGVKSLTKCEELSKAA